MLIAAGLLAEVIEHARAEYDDECCGLLGYSQASDGAPARAERVQRARNVFASPKRFEIDGLELLHTIEAFESDGLELGAIYHSHTHTEPYPSQTDINFAANWPGLEWVIVGLAGAEPEVRCFMIEDGTVTEVELTVA